MSADPAARRPNVIVIIMDDLAWGDLGCHGNPHVRTPHLDNLHAQSTRLVRYVSGPVCTPARASLMTGRYPYRTRAIDTYLGRSMMDPDEVTLAEVLRDAGYATGISGKWHLGDHYPMRAMDKGFDESFVHFGGGLRQPGHLTPNDGYFNPDLLRNGQIESTTGYCTDLFTDEAIRFIERHRDEPFFLYLATNAPHAPLEIDDPWAQPYRDAGLNDTFARLYGMVENIDWNVGRLLDRLEGLGLADDTIVIYTSDHGPCASTRHEGELRYNANLRAHKGTVYEGGLRVPCFWRWPGRFDAGRDVDRVTNPIDIMPTLAAACGATLPTDRTIDGTNLLPLLTGETGTDAWPDRTVYLQWHRGDVPVRDRNFAAVGQRYKLLRPHDSPADELYDLDADPGETRDLARELPEVVTAMRRDYERWFDDVCSTRPDLHLPPRIVVGAPDENPVVLTRQDWRMKGPDGWGDEHEGYWLIRLQRGGEVQVALRFRRLDHGGTAHVTVGDTSVSVHVAAGVERCDFEALTLPAGDLRVDAWIIDGDRRLSPRCVDLCHLAVPASESMLRAIAGGRSFAPNIVR